MSDTDLYATCSAALRDMSTTNEARSIWNFPNMTPVLVDVATVTEIRTCDRFEWKIGWVKYRSKVLMSEYAGLDLDYHNLGDPLFAEWVEGNSYFRVFQDPNSLGNLKQVQITEGRMGKPYLRQIVRVAGDGAAKDITLKYHVYFLIDEKGCTQRAFDAFAGFEDTISIEGVD